METGATFLMNLLDITGIAAKVKEGKNSGDVPTDFLAALEGNKESFLAVLKESTEKDVTLENLLALLKENVPLLEEGTVLAEILAPLFQDGIQNKADLLKKFAQASIALNPETVDQNMDAKTAIDQSDLLCDLVDNVGKCSKMGERSSFQEGVVDDTVNLSTRPKTASISGEVGTIEKNNVKINVINDYADKTDKPFHASMEVHSFEPKPPGPKGPTVNSETAPETTSEKQASNICVEDNFHKKGPGLDSASMKMRPSEENSETGNKSVSTGEKANHDGISMKTVLRNGKNVISGKGPQDAAQSNDAVIHKQDVSGEITSKMKGIAESDKGTQAEASKNENSKFSQNFTRDISGTTGRAELEKSDPMTKTNSLRQQALMQENMGMKVGKADSSEGGEASLTNNQYGSDKAVEILQTKETQTGSPRTLQRDVISQIIEKSILQIKNGQTSIRISLKPEELGHLRMQVKTDNDQVAIKILAENALVKTIIETNAGQLKDELQNQGLQMGKFDVSVDQGEQQNQGMEKDFKAFDQSAFGDEGAEDGDLEKGQHRQNIFSGTNSDCLVDYFA